MLFCTVIVRRHLGHSTSCESRARPTQSIVVVVFTLYSVKKKHILSYRLAVKNERILLTISTFITQRILARKT